MDAKAETRAEISEIRLADLLRIALQRKWLIICGTLALGIAGAALALAVPKKYTATILVDPITQSPGLDRMGGLGAIASEFGGLASMVGLQLPQENAMRAESIAVLKSAALTEKYISANNLLPVLYPKLWDAATAKWKTSNPQKIPTLWKANRYFESKIRQVGTDPKTGLVTMTITWTDPRLAAEWANGLVRMTNDYLRQKAIAEAQRNIAYLTEQANKTDMLGVKQVIYSIMQSEISNAMLARGNEQYALKVLDPAEAPERPSFPKPVLWTVAGLFIGAFLSFLAALLRADAPSRRVAPDTAEIGVAHGPGARYSKAADSVPRQVLPDQSNAG